MEILRLSTTCPELPPPKQETRLPALGIPCRMIQQAEKQICSSFSLWQNV